MTIYDMQGPASMPAPRGDRGQSAITMTGKIRLQQRSEDGTLRPVPGFSDEPMPATITFSGMEPE